MRDRLLAAEKVKAIDWRDGALYLLDQRILPFEETWIAYTSAAGVAEAIRSMVVRGAPAIGISAAYGIVLAARARIAEGGDWYAALEEDFMLLADSRPTAVNLFWALGRMHDRLDRLKDNADPLEVLEAEAIAIHESDREANLSMAQLGVDFIRKHPGQRPGDPDPLQHGALATGGWHALGVIRGAFIEAWSRSMSTESTPVAARLAADRVELAEGIPVTLNVDSAAAHIKKTKGPTWVIVGADRITANGDVANKIGTYQLAVNAMHHGVRFMVVAPSSTIDMNLASGDDIPIEERDGRELLEVGGKRVGADVDAFNPVFDVTPADLIDAIVTEKGIVERPDTAKMAQLMCRKRLH
jgi:methylthioribose-1-phosphate isomerase